MSLLPRFIILLLVVPLASAFQTPSGVTRPAATKLHLVPLPDDQLLATITSTPSSSSLLLAEESWRQYVPLAVSALVIVDILLGSPAANSILGMTRSPEEGEEQDDAPRVQTKGERVDSGQLADEALEKARNALEWQTYKEETKRDEDRMEDLRKKMDAQMRDFDNK